MIPAFPQDINQDFIVRESILNSGGVIFELGTSDPSRIMLGFQANPLMQYSTSQTLLAALGFQATNEAGMMMLKYSDIGSIVCKPWYGKAVGQIQVLEVFYRPHQRR